MIKEYDWKCTRCEKKMTLDAERKARWCCGKRMIRDFHPTPVVWKTPGCTRTVPFPDKEKK